MNQIIIPSDIIYNILLNLSYLSLLKFCQSSKLINNICHNDYFWKNQEFGVDNSNDNILWVDKYKYKWLSENTGYLITYLINFLKQNGYTVDNVRGIALPEMYLLGIFLLPIEIAKIFLPLYPYQFDIVKVPISLYYMSKWLNQELPKRTGDVLESFNESIHYVPSGVDNGYRKVIQYLVDYEYTPIVAERRLRELGITFKEKFST